MTLQPLSAAFLGAGVAIVLVLPLVYIVVRRSARRARLAERRARNAERMAEIGAMTGGLAHEIKNPLSTIGLNAQLLGEAIADSKLEPYERDRLARRVGTLRREVERLRDILEGFLNFAGAMRLDARPHDLRTLVEELADFYLPQAQGQGVQLRVDLGPQPVMASVDAAQLKQAILNLMINATQAMAAMPGPGAPPADPPDPHAPAATSAASTAGASRQPSDPPPTASSPRRPTSGDPSRAGAPHAPMRELILRTESARDETGPVARIRVIDTGPGVPLDKLDHIFTPYFTTKPGGSGLGLPITRRIVEEHHGRIEVNTAPGKGTEFVVVLPRG